MKIAVTFAMEREFRPWRKNRKFQGSGDRYSGRCGDSEIAIFLTGIGAERAEESSRGILDYMPDICIISGLAGGLRLEHRPGAILAARAIIDSRARRPCHEWHGHPDHGYGEGGGEPVKPDKRLLAIAEERGAKITERFISVQRIAASAQQKSALAQFADAADMESYVLMDALSRSGIPAISIRAVSDPAEFSMPYDFSRALDSSGRVRVGDFLGQIAKSPAGLVSLARLAVSSARAAASLARFMDGYVEAIENKEQFSESPLEQVALR